MIKHETLQILLRTRNNFSVKIRHWYDKKLQSMACWVWIKHCRSCFIYVNMDLENLNIFCRVWWCMPVIPIVWEADAGGSQAGGQPGQLNETLPQYEK